MRTKIFYILAFGDIAKVLKSNVDQSDVVRYSDKFEDNPSISYLMSELGLKMEKFREPSRRSMVITVLLSIFFKHLKIHRDRNEHVLFSHVYSYLPMKLVLKGYDCKFFLDDLDRWQEFLVHKGFMSYFLRTILGIDLGTYEVDGKSVRGLNLEKLCVGRFYEEPNAIATNQIFISPSLIFISSGDTCPSSLQEVAELAKKCDLEFVFRPHPRLDKKDKRTNDIRTFLPLNLLEPNGFVVGFGSYALVEAAEAGWKVFNIEELYRGANLNFYLRYIQSFNSTVLTKQKLADICWK